MAYQTGTFSSPADLVSTIQAFATTNGWTLSGNVLKKGSVYAAVWADGVDVKVQGGLGESGGVLTSPCPDTGHIDGGDASYPYFGELQSSYPATYHLFAHTNPDVILCAVNYNVVWWQWMAFGSIVKYGDWVGGEFYCGPHNGSMLSAGQTDAYRVQSSGSWLSSGLALFWGGKENWGNTYPDGSYLHCEIDGYTWASSTRETGGLSAAYLKARHPEVMGDLIKNSVSTWNQQATLIPYYLFADRPDSKQSLIGQVEHIRSLRLDNLNPGDIITIGSDKWMVFPWVKKDLSLGYSSSGPYGFAVRYDGP